MDLPIPVLLDTDIGSDIDDALALAYLLAQPRCELVGIATATGDTFKRAALADRICRDFGRPETPIVPGLEGPLLDGPGQPNVPQFEALSDRKIERDFGEGSGWDAIEFLRQTIRARPNKVTLLTIGPLTNIAALFVADPEIPSLVRQVVMMAGTYGLNEAGRRNSSEWNCRCDPLATVLVFRHARPGSLLAAGLDVTLECSLAASECRERLMSAGPTLSSVLSMAEIWFQGRERVTFHDPLAAALIFEPGLGETVAGRVEVVVSDGPDAGNTDFTPCEDGPHRVCSSARSERFLEHYFEVLSANSVGYRPA